MNPARAPLSQQAFGDLLDLLREAPSSFEGGVRAVDDLSVIEGYRWLTEVLTVALDCYVWADPERPSFVELVGPTRKFGGDNPDAFYYFAPVDPQRTYRIRGQLGDAVYLSLCVYGGPTDGRWSNRIVSSMHNRQMEIGRDGQVEITLSAQPQDGNWLKLDADAVCVVTRDYLLHPAQERKATWQIEALPTARQPTPLTDQELATKLRCTANFIRDLLGVCPIPGMGEPNSVMPPYRVPEITYGWAAPDATYAMGRFDLSDDQVLFIKGRSPTCAFWNLVLWNPFLQTYDYRYQRVSRNGGEIQLADDGSWELAVAARDPGHANWISTAGHERGVLWFRWFLCDELPPQPQTRLGTIP